MQTNGKQNLRPLIAPQCSFFGVARNQDFIQGKTNQSLRLCVCFSQGQQENKIKTAF
jgi:hypothetical protein